MLLFGVVEFITAVVSSFAFRVNQSPYIFPVRIMLSEMRADQRDNPWQTTVRIQIKRFKPAETIAE
jgi:hypothetical protein